MTLREGAAASILTGQAHRGALHEERTEGEQLTVGPVDVALLRHFDALLQHPLELGMHGEAFRKVVMCLTDGVDRALRDGRRIGQYDLVALT